MDITDEQRELLKSFENHGAPCAVFTARPVEQTLVVLRSAVSGGLLRSIAGPTAISGNNLWFECLTLTDDGRRACGLWVATVAPREKQGGLFD